MVLAREPIRKSWFGQCYATLLSFLLTLFDHLDNLFHDASHLLFFSPLGLSRPPAKIHTLARISAKMEFQPKDHRSILITGCSSGIGKHLAFHLARQGYDVHATFRKEEDASAIMSEWVSLARSLSAGTKEGDGGGFHGRIVPKKMDIRDPASIASLATRFTSEDTPPLIAVIHNAGIPSFAPWSSNTVSDSLSEALDVHVRAPMEMTRQLLPVLRRHQGRVLFVGSLAAWFTLPCMGPYSSSKAALEMATRALAMEEVHHDVVDTPMWEKGIKTLEKESTSTSADARIESFTEWLLMMAKANLPLSSQHVARAVDHALKSPFPKRVYHIGWDAKIAAWIPTYLNHTVVDSVLEWVYRVFA